MIKSISLDVLKDSLYQCTLAKKENGNDTYVLQISTIKQV